LRQAVMAQAFHTGILALYRKKALAEQTATM